MNVIVFYNYSHSEDAGSNPSSGEGGRFYCGESSYNLFWTCHDQKHMASMQNPDCKTFYVNWTSGSCVCHRYFEYTLGQSN